MLESRTWESDFLLKSPAVVPFFLTPNLSTLWETKTGLFKIKTLRNLGENIAVLLKREIRKRGLAGTFRKFLGQK